VALFHVLHGLPARCIHIEAEESPWAIAKKYPGKFDIDELRCIFAACARRRAVDAFELTHEYDIVGLSGRR